MIDLDDATLLKLRKAINGVSVWQTSAHNAMFNNDRATAILCMEWHNNEAQVINSILGEGTSILYNIPTLGEKHEQP